ncbi:MAG: CinA family nicotinamide mononucleotide deamidase-related protein [Fibrobacter sp.]|jgi:nicotinamide-nucleotide amidase|nr:CinA family nicotinamide mononucleotide deamidase-related protein [Fibrobacter sp.]
MKQSNPSLAIICLGTELTQGFTLNTNAKMFSAKVRELGFDVAYHLTLPDNASLWKNTFDMIMNAGVETVIVSGGLGPTADDKTRFLIAETLSRPLVYHAEWEARIQKQFSERSRPYSPENRVQAMFPEGAEVLENPVGSAPGFKIRQNGITFFMIPGVPSEAETLFELHIVPWLKAKRSVPLFTREIHLMNIPEAELESCLKKVSFPDSVSWSSLPEPDGIIFRIYSHESADILSSVMSEAHRVLVENSQAVIFSENKDDLIRRITDILQKRNETFGTAESCTGGLIASEVTRRAGVSGVFSGGIVAYHNRIKEHILHIPAKIIAENGAVSEAVVSAMAANARRVLGCDWVLATSGIAGPDGGSPEKPVGLVWMAVAGKQEIFTFFEKFSGNREQIRIKSVYKVLQQFFLQLTKQKSSCFFVQ